MDRRIQTFDLGLGIWRLDPVRNARGSTSGTMVDMAVDSHPLTFSRYRAWNWETRQSLRLKTPLYHLDLRCMDFGVLAHVPDLLAGELDGTPVPDLSEDLIGRFVRCHFTTYLKLNSELFDDVGVGGFSFL